MSRRVIAVLEVMWDPTHAGRKAPFKFRINPRNFTGKRLYSWLNEDDELWVTNACSRIVSNAQGRAEADPETLALNLGRCTLHGKIDLLLVCGKIAESAFKETCTLNCAERVIVLPHPAARVWSKRQLDLVKQLIANGTGNYHISFNGKRLSIKPLESCDFIPF